MGQRGVGCWAWVGCARNNEEKKSITHIELHFVFVYIVRCRVQFLQLNLHNNNNNKHYNNRSNNMLGTYLDTRIHGCLAFGGHVCARSSSASFIRLFWRIHLPAMRSRRCLSVCACVCVSVCGRVSVCGMQCSSRAVQVSAACGTVSILFASLALQWKMENRKLSAAVIARKSFATAATTTMRTHNDDNTQTHTRANKPTRSFWQTHANGGRRRVKSVPADRVSARGRIPCRSSWAY